jgi:hypothetical protein
MKRKKLQLLTVFVGTLLALAIICTQLFHFHATTISKQVKTEQQNNEKGQPEISLPDFSFSLPTSIAVQSTIDQYFLFEISFVKSDEEHPCAQAPVIAEKLLDTLFSVIISPNAP